MPMSGQSGSEGHGSAKSLSKFLFKQITAFLNLLTELFESVLLEMKKN